ncbi:MAG: hypothetical protein K2O95_06025 [Clostridia bacterium]|nr:hypothetical protein [Clostridia bacterium]MDE6757679.1 hypothetical protein [Clostridia bacterium]MDE7079653.1 hypothetical protein [Clostridia bacterium]
MNEEIEKAVFRRAVGYDVQEIIEEYSGENELLKRKVSSKHYPPDMTAVKTMLELGLDNDELKSMSDDQLIELKKRLLNQLNDMTKGEVDENNYPDK